MELTEQAERRVAFFGGSFDPPHRGHLAVARAAQEALRLDTVLFAPVAAQPLKPGGAGADFADRVAMTRLAIEGEMGFSLSLVDAPTETGKPNYTLETLEKLRTDLPEGGVLYCLMGADSFFGLRGWHRAAEIPFAAPLVVAARPGQGLDDLDTALPEGLRLETDGEAEQAAGMRRYVMGNAAGERAPFYLLPDLHVEISASAIRERLQGRRGGKLEEVTPEAVAEYIRAHGLYGGRR